MSSTRLVLVATILAIPLAVSAQGPDAPTSEFLGLDRAVAIALEHNRQLAIAALDVEKARQQVAEVRTRRLPSVSVSALEALLLTSIDFTVRSGQFGTFPGIGRVPAVDTKIDTRRQMTTFLTGQVMQPLSQLHQIGLAIRAREAGMEIAMEALRQARQGVTNQVMQAYYAIVQTQSSLDAAEQSLKYCEELDQLTDRYFVRQVVLKSDTLDVKAQVARIRYQIATLGDALASQRESLNHLMGRDLRTEFRVQPVPPLNRYETDLDAAREVALDRRPEIRQARLKAQQAGLDRRAQAAGAIPQVSLALNYLSMFNVPFLPRNVMTAGVLVTWEPFDWGRRRTEVAQKAMAIEQADHAVREAEQAVLVEVGARYRKLQQAVAFVEVTRLARDTRQEKLRVVTNQYPLKAALLRDVLEQQAAWAEANNQYQQALVSAWIARADFERALGGD